MKKISIPLFILLISSVAKGVISAPIISMTTTLPIGHSISFKLIGSRQYDTVQVDFGDGTLVETTFGSAGVTVNGLIAGTQTVKVYGTKIRELDCSYNLLTGLDVHGATDLTQIWCNNNQLTSLDVSNNLLLESLTCSNNNIVNLVMTADNSVLTDVTCDHNKLTSLDVSILKLNSLVCNNNLLSDLKINDSIGDLTCDYNHLTTLDVANRNKLYILSCNNNYISSLDLSADTALVLLNCPNNKLTHLDVSNNFNLSSVICYRNSLNFATLPEKQSTWYYYYASQNPMTIPSSVTAGDECNLSSQFSIEGATTNYTWKTKRYVTLTEGIDYNIVNGVTTFLKAQDDSVFCEMTNSTFPAFTGGYVLTTTNMKIIKNTTQINESKLQAIEVQAINKTVLITTNANSLVSVFDTNGRLIISKQIFNGTSEVQLQNPGIYMIKVSGNSNSLTKKIFIE